MSHVSSHSTDAERESQPRDVPSADAHALPPVRRAHDAETPRPTTVVDVARSSVGELAGWFASTLFHIALLVVLGLLFMPELKQELPELLATSAVETPDELAPVVLDETVREDRSEDLADALAALPDAPITNEIELSTLNESPAPTVSVELSDIGFESVPVNDMLSEVGSFMGRGLEGRGEAARKVLIAQGGGTQQSEESVGAALDWLARHQNTDGSWSFNHAMTICQGRCSHPGNYAEAYNGATAMALLPFLGAGQTHREGKYQRTVAMGLKYLTEHMQINSNGGSLHERLGNMYSHGLGSIALCEAYAMSQDRALLRPAQASLNFIAWAQDEVGGGWRYQPGTPGDTSVLGWQVMALRSGHMAYLAIPPATLVGVERFLNGVQGNGGATFGYMSPPRNARDAQATTAIGLLCRMLLGMDRYDPGLQRGVELLSQWGPSESNMYYNYYATQVLHHYEGEEWKRWNTVMRDHLVNTQSHQGHEAGSWYFAGANARDHDSGALRGGRLYCTAMAAMILEVYYRHLPLYQKGSVDTEFERALTGPVEPGKAPEPPADTASEEPARSVGEKKDKAPAGKKKPAPN